MVNLDHSFPPPPSTSLSSVELLKRAIETYCASFKFCIRLYRFPIFAFLIAILPISLFDHKAESTVDYIKLASAEVWFIVCAFISGYSLAFRSLALQRMVLTSGTDFVSAMAYANRFGKRIFQISMLTYIVQLLLLIPFFCAGYIVWQSKSGFAFNFGVPAYLLTLVSAICFFFLDYVFHCFRFSLATAEGGWKANFKLAMTFITGGFARGLAFEALMYSACICLYWMLSPETYYYLPQVGTVGVAGVLFPHNPPAFLNVIDRVFAAVIDFVVYPVGAIWSAYFVNDVRLRMASVESKNL